MESRFAPFSRFLWRSRSIGLTDGWIELNHFGVIDLRIKQKKCYFNAYITLFCKPDFFFPCSLPTETFQRSSATRQSVRTSEPFGKRLLWANIQRRRKPKGNPQNCGWPLACGLQSSPETPPRQLQTVQELFLSSLPNSIDIAWAIVFCNSLCLESIPCFLDSPPCWLFMIWKKLII